MTKDDIIRMAREVGAGEPESLFGRTDYIVMTRYDLERFAAKAYAEGVKAEREACAQAAEGFDACDPKHIAAAFRAGAKAMFDALLYRVANNWHPRAQAECNAQNEWATEWAADALDEVSPEDCAKWKSIQQSWGDGYKAGAAAEREACAKVCDDLVRSYWNSTGDEDEPDAYDCAAAIRARGEKE